VEQRLDQGEFRGKRVTVLGLGREGAAVARFLVPQGAVVTVTDLKSAEELRPMLEDLTPLPVHYELGGHPPRVLDCDLLFVSPGVPLDAPIMVEARQRRLLLSSEARLFCRLCPAPIVGITGSSGKTTTCTLVARMLEAGGEQVHLGGNIGSPLIGRLDQIRPADTVVVELSSFQLDFFGPVLDADPRGDLVSPLFPGGGWSPPYASVLNVTPNHLDRHPTMDAYTAAKFKILAHQQPQDHAVVGWDDPVARGFARHCVGQVAFFSVHEQVPEGAYLKEDSLLLRHAEGEVVICPVSDVRLRGMHNVANVLAACALADLLGVAPHDMAEVVRGFTGVQHRLEPVRQLQGAWYYNDSIATSPERAMAALNSFAEPLVLLAGGRDKHLPWDDWADLVSRKAAHVIVFGEAALLIEGVLSRLGQRAPPIHRAESVADAVEIAREVAQPGQVVLFSPGGTSFDAFRDYVERGETFRRLVEASAA
jgi:UDP-N-acetylmuramoylalanine--D-glutamate ligase